VIGHSGRSRLQRRTEDRPAERLRARALEALREYSGPVLLRDLASELGCSVHTLDYTVRVLERAGLVAVESDGPRCPRWVRAS
jgi:DNA-binding MarR family transcriptional regulator